MDPLVELHVMEETQIQRALRRTNLRDSPLRNFPVVNRQLNGPRRSELVVGMGSTERKEQHRYSSPNDSLVNLSVTASKEEFASTFLKPQSHPDTKATLQYYPRITWSADILPFPEPAVDYNSQPYWQHHLTEDRGVIYPPSFDTPPLPHVNDSCVLDIDNALRLTTRGEILECYPSNDVYKVSLIVS